MVANLSGVGLGFLLALSALKNGLVTIEQRIFRVNNTG